MKIQKKIELIEQLKTLTDFRKDNQEGLKDKAKKVIANFTKPTNSYTNDIFTIEGNNMTRRKVDIF